MRQHPILALAVAFLLVSLGSTEAKEAESRRYQQLLIRADQQSANIDINSYTLITNNPKGHRIEATQIMRVKADWPRAMQTKDKALFESVLAPDFTFRAEDEWFERDAYIHDRVNSKEQVLKVRYENLVLQIFDRIAVLTYRNVLNHTDEKGAPDTLYLSWADVFVKGRDGWKIGGSHLISARSERGH